MADGTASDNRDTSLNTSPETDLSERVLGDFHLLRRLGRGAMAEVYLAEQRTLKRQVAIKVLKSHLAKDESSLKRFEQEAQSAASLVHANIVQIYEVGCTDGIHYIAQEYVPGYNLREYIVRQGPPEAKVAVSIIRQAAAALLKAGEKGIVHRDIKPENILLSQSGEAKVADFGLSRVMENGQALNLTQVGMTMGTPLYMSPEQVEGKPLDPRSDIYSLGVTCYHLLAGHPPFRGDTPLSVAIQHLKKLPERLESIRSDLPPALCRIVHKMLAKAPAQRYQNAKELLQDLRRLHIEDEVEWPEEISALPLDDVSRIAPDALEMTQRLGVVMKKEAASRSSRRMRDIFLVGSLFSIAVVLGVVFSLAIRKPFLLSNENISTPLVERYETVENQFEFALWADSDPQLSEQAWLSVITYFPEDYNFYYHRKAAERLALFYFGQERYDEALIQFDQLANVEELEKESRAFGLAGKFLVQSIQNKEKEAQETLGQFLNYRSDLKHPVLMTAIFTHFQRHQQQFGDKQADLILELLNESMKQGQPDSP